MVVIFDEFDALRKERDDAAEHGELKRVVNAFFQMLDSFEEKSLLITATNHDQILDSAVWRRFDEALVFDLPNIEELHRLPIPLRMDECFKNVLKVQQNK